MIGPAFLMCPPDFYDVAYEINPWMSVKHKADKEKARKQWEAYYELLSKELKVRVELLEPVKGLPDLVFTANGGLVKKRIFIRSNFRHKERKGEEVPFQTWFRKNGYIVKTLERPFCFEGEGDALFMNHELYTGFHFRSDMEAHDLVSGFLKQSYYALELRDKRFYHLDTCFAPLNEETALLFLPAFEPYAQMTLLENIPDPVRVPETEALRFACNAVVIGKKIVIPSECPQTAAELEKRGFHVYPLEFSEFIKAGGAAKCLVLKI